MKTLSEVQDELSVVGNFVECAYMACESLCPELGHPLVAVLDAASSKMKDIGDAIEAIRQGPGAKLKETKR